MRLIPLLVFAVLMFVQVPATMATQVILSPDQDVYTNSVNAATNYGGDADLYLGKGTYWGLGFYRAYLEFDVSSITGTVVSAELQLYQYSAGPAAGGLPCDAHRVLAAWDEGAITWSTQPAHDSLIYDSQDVGNSGYQGWIVWDITPLVADWVSGAVDNYGVVLKHYLEISAGASRYGIFHATESSVVDYRPQLVIEVDEPVAVEAGTWGSIKSLYR